MREERAVHVARKLLWCVEGGGDLIPALLGAPGFVEGLPDVAPHDVDEELGGLLDLGACKPVDLEDGFERDAEGECAFGDLRERRIGDLEGAVGSRLEDAGLDRRSECSDVVAEAFAQFGDGRDLPGGLMRSSKTALRNLKRFCASAAGSVSRR